MKLSDLNINQPELEKPVENQQDDDQLDEVTAVRKKSVRRGKVIRRRDCPPGFRLVNKTRCVRQGSRERQRRRRAGRRAARKGKSQRRISARRSRRIRSRRKLKRVKFR